MGRKSNARFTPSRINRDDLLADTFLEIFSERFKTYTNSVSRERLLSGIQSEPKYGKLTVRAAVLFVVALAAAKDWQGDPIRAAKYLRARHLSKFLKAPPSYMPPDVSQAQRQNREKARYRIEAIVALGMARSAGYSTHSRVLWRCMEQALCTDGLGAHSQPTRDSEWIDTYFEWVRGRLNYLYRKHGKPQIYDEADKVFALLSRRLQRAALSQASLYFLLHAKHREV